MDKMLKIILLTLCLHFMKSLCNSSVVGRPDESNQWLQSFNSFTSPIINWFDTNSKENQYDSHSNMENLPTSTESPKAFNDMLEILQTEISESDDNGKKYYEKMLINLKDSLTQKSRYIKIFLKDMWYAVDLGPYGSKLRSQNASFVDKVLENIKDFFNWISRTLYELITWDLKPKTDKSSDKHMDEKQEHENNDEHKTDDHEHEHKVDDENPDDAHKTTSQTDQDAKNFQKAAAKFHIAPFDVKVDMNVTCRIIDERDGLNKNKPNKDVKPGEFTPHPKRPETRSQEPGLFSGLMGGLLNKSKEQGADDSKNKQESNNHNGAQSINEHKPEKKDGSANGEKDISEIKKEPKVNLQVINGSKPKEEISRTISKSDDKREDISDGKLKVHKTSSENRSRVNEDTLAKD